MARVPQSWNRYAYTMGNPLKYTDPTGNCVWDVCVGEFLAVGALFAGVAVILESPNAADPTRTNGEVIGSSIRDSFSAVQSIILQSSANEASGAESAEAPGDGGESAADSEKSERSRQLGDRAREGTAAEAEQQLSEIEKQQARTRTGKADGDIDNIEKSEQRMKHRHKQIKDLKDAEKEYE